MALEHYIAGDWGTSNLRLYLCEFDSTSNTAKVLEVRSGQGVAAIAKDINTHFETVLFSLVDDWLLAYPINKIMLSGMVGSNIGWHLADYAACPANAASISRGTIEFQAQGRSIHIVSGLSCQNPFGQFDVMRGEELQLLGWLLQHNNDPAMRLFALPGTHNKWVLAQDGQILSFSTAMTGELFNLLCEHSVLLTKAEPSLPVDEQAFDQAVALSYSPSAPDLTQILFSTRAQQIAGTLTKDNARDYLSGLIIANDIRSALRCFEPLAMAKGKPITEIVLIGEASLCQAYAKVIEQRSNIACRSTLSDDIAKHGFSAVYQQLRA